ncbi:MAG: orotidine-5'-phosphate decarboxylase [Parvibaculaceae bacterium]
MTTNPICVALDTPEIARARELARALKGKAGYVKIGMEFFYAHGPRGYEEVAREGLPVFLDLKLHDIPNTVASALKSLMRLDPKPAIINVHAAGGTAMMKAAANAVAGQTKLIAVTVLTSLTDDDLWAAGFDRSRDGGAHAVQLARLAQQAGLDGVVCSAREVKAIKAATAKDFLTVVPGIRPADADVQDQKRIATPRAARDDGADILVIGRPITGAADPAQAASAIAESLA